jgi:hypothetical protein
MKILLVILILFQTPQIQAKQWTWKTVNKKENNIQNISNQKQPINKEDDTVITTDKSISKQEFVIEKNNENLSFHEDGFMKIDTDKNNLISEDEYLFYFIGFENDKNDENSKEIIKTVALQNFTLLDTNKDKYLNKEEFFYKQIKQDTENIQKIFTLLDKDKNNNLSSNENDVNVNMFDEIEKELKILDNITLP